MTAYMWISIKISRRPVLFYHNETVKLFLSFKAQVRPYRAVFVLSLAELMRSKRKVRARCTTTCQIVMTHFYCQQAGQPLKSIDDGVV